MELKNTSSSGNTNNVYTNTSGTGFDEKSLKLKDLE
jgi:uncharacterized protein (UPF0335 family)